MLCMVHPLAAPGSLGSQHGGQGSRHGRLCRVALRFQDYTLFGIVVAAGVGIVFDVLMLYPLNEFRADEVSTTPSLMQENTGD